MTYDIPSDVIVRAQKGDTEAHRAIVETFRRPVRVTVAQFLRGRYASEIEDAVQDVFLKVFSHIRDFDFSRRVKFSTWIYTFVRNHCFDKLKKKRLPVFSMNASSRDDEDGSTDWIAGDAPTPDGEASRREFRFALRAALESLPRELSRVFRMREFDGLEFHAIAAKLRQPLGTVKSKHYRALDRLRFLLRGFRSADERVEAVALSA
ncbi:MAG: RNA polymerase sigma factor [Planctomycetota bacterium JB042]